MSDLKNKTVFVLEDNPQNRMIFGLVLRKHGAHYFFEPWGRSALLHLTSLRKVDLIILDLMLPGGVSGYDVFEQIRELPEYQDVPIVAVSAVDPSEGIAKTRAKGFAGFIAKPIDDNLFPIQLAKIVDGENVWYAGERGLV